MRQKNLQDNLTPDEYAGIVSLLHVAKKALEMERDKPETAALWKALANDNIDMADHLIKVFLVEGT
jgi:hypothetical protein